MVENKDFPYRMSNQSTVDYSLITLERTEKLELLIHLLSNSPHAIVLCGSKGVGKTTLLTVFQQRRNALWQTYIVQGREDLTVEQIQTQLLETYSPTQTLESFFEQLTKQQQKIVLIIDDAGSLAPQLITTIIDYANSHPVLKVVFVLSHDDLAIKTHSDSAIEECHIIEIPPLSESQCGDFLQHLAIKSVFEVPVQGITDSMIASVYQQTHGIPEKIIAQLPSLNHPQKPKKPIARWVLAIAFALCAAGYLLLVLSKNNIPNLAWLSSVLESLNIAINR
ncbi:MAG: AAA family ATPase [Methylococcales bacterium]|nr:AAA family ATPase [Methylococcales bacterium]